MKNPRSIVPIDNKEEILLAIWDSLEAIRAAIKSGADGHARNGGKEHDAAPARENRKVRKKKQ